MNEASPVETAKPAPLRILLVEDDDGAALLLQAMLSNRKFGAFRIRRAASLSAAVPEAASGETDLVLLDLGLPDSAGLDTFVQMHAAAPHVPIIVLTGFDDEALATRTVQQGAQDYIVKGQVDAASLARAIRYAVERFRTQQALNEERDLLRSLIDNIPDQVYLKDSQSRFVAVNPVTARFFGSSSPEQIIGKSDADFLPCGLAAQFLAEEQALLRGDLPCVNREVAITDDAGRTRWMMTTKVPLRNTSGSITRLLGVNRDVTERKAVEEAIGRLNIELEKRVADRTAALIKTNEDLRSEVAQRKKAEQDLLKAIAQLEEHDRARSEFVFNVSHELKTPLTSMKYEIQNLITGVVGPLPDRVALYLEMLNEDSQRMSRTVEDILDMARLESKTMSLHMVKAPFAGLIRRGAKALAAQAEAKRINVVLSLPRGAGFVTCDPLKMERVIMNITGNAIKFTPQSGRVEIATHRDVQNGAFLALDISDTGIGIPPEAIGKVAKKYFRVGNHVDGTGLGLAIAREIIELHGGRMEIASPPPGKKEGVLVTVLLPAAEPPVILMAHGDASIRESVRQQLSSEGYRVAECATGQEAVEMIETLKPDMLMLDLRLPIINGEDIILRAKADPALRGIPILILTDTTIDRAKHEILTGFGISAMFKPWSEDELLDRVEVTLLGENIMQRGDKASTTKAENTTNEP